MSVKIATCKKIQTTVFFCMTIVKLKFFRYTIAYTVKAMLHGLWPIIHDICVLLIHEICIILL